MWRNKVAYCKEQLQKFGDRFEVLDKITDEKFDAGTLTKAESRKWGKGMEALILLEEFIKENIETAFD